MPFLDGGDIEATKKNAEANVASLQPWVAKGYDIVVPGPTCSYMLKREYPWLLNSEKAKVVAAKTFDICEYLMSLHSEGKLDTRFAAAWARSLIRYRHGERRMGLSLATSWRIPGTSVQVLAP
jgi:Fe-S oxidoreductase